MPKVGKKHFKYTKEGRAKAKKHAKKTGLEIEYMGGGVVNRKYYASGGAVYGAARKRKPTGRLTVEDVARSRKPTGKISARDRAFATARMRKPTGRLSDKDIKRAMHKTRQYGVIASGVGAAVKATYLKARKRKPKGRLTIDDIKRALGQSKAQNKAKGGTIKKPDDSWIDPSLWLGPGLGPALKKARKRKPKGRLSIDDIGRALGASKAQNR